MFILDEIANKPRRLYKVCNASKRSKRTVLSLLFLLFLISFTSCEKTVTEFQAIPKPKLETLEGTKWKFVGFYDVETNTPKEVENPSAYGRILVFLSKEMEEKAFGYLLSEYSDHWNMMDSTFFSNTPFAELPLQHLIGTVWSEANGFCKIDYSTSKMKMGPFGNITRIGFSGDLDLYEKKMNAVQSFLFSNEELKLYYNNENNYLLFERCCLPFEYYGVEVF